MEQLRGQIGTYRLVDHVARGRSGDTYRAQEVDGTPVAVKVHDRADDGQGEVDRLVRIDHPGVVTLLDHGRTGDGRRWLALPWIDGPSLTDVLAARSPLTVDQARHLLGPLAAAVDALHRAGIIHGDLSPNNVIVGQDGRPILLDLGASAEVDPSAVDETTGLEVTVTPRYASPEVAEGRAPGPASDRYAIGLIAYEALTGAFPFEDVATPIAMLGHHASTEPVAPSEHRPDLPPGAEATLLRALAKDPASRQPTTAAIVDGLAAPAPNPTPALAAAPATDRRSARTPDPVVEPGRPSGPGRWIRRAAGASALLLIAVIGLAWFDGRGTTSDSPAASPWSAGRAAGLSCNLLQVADFETAELPEGYYTGDLANTTAVVAGAGIEGTAALQVGDAGAYGLYGEIIPIGTADRYVLSAWVRTDGQADAAAIFIDYLDADYVQLTARRDRLEPDQLLDTVDGVRVTVESEAPERAVFAIPTVFKDGSGGALLVDEVVFGPSETCLDLAS